MDSKIPLDRLDNFLSQDILSRGAEYFYQGLITKINSNNGLFNCIASGQQEYEVSVEITDNIITHHSCSCPFDNKLLCKHKAGLIIYIQELDFKKLRNKKNFNSNKFT